MIAVAAGDAEPFDAGTEIELQVIGRTNRGVRTDIRATAEAQVREIDVLPEPSIGADLADQIVHRKRLTELQLVRLEEAVAGAECFVGVAPAIERLKFAVRSETE